MVAAGAFFAAIEAVLWVTLPVARHATLPNHMIQAHLEGASFRYDPDLYWYWTDPLGGQGSPVNEHGFVRAKPMTMAHPDGVTRVITFGDSQTFGAGMTPDRTYSAFAEAAMGAGWEVLNAGISGYRTLNVYRLLQLRIEAYTPDAVVIDCMPFDSAPDDGPLVGTRLSAGGVASVLREILWKSRAYYLLRLGMERSDPSRPRWLDDEAQGRGGRELGNHHRISEWGRERGVEVIFMQYPVMDEFFNYGCMTRPGELPAGHYIVPACDRLAASGHPARDLFQDRNHLTELGNELVGGYVADTLREWRAGAPRPRVAPAAAGADNPHYGPANQGAATGPAPASGEHPAPAAGPPR